MAVESGNMGKHDSGYSRVDRDHYPTPPWVVDALAEHVELTDRVVWEPATGDGQMADALKTAGAAHVYCSDVANYDYRLDAVFDFLTGQKPPRLPYIDLIATNPAYGERNKTAERFIEVGLQHIATGGTLALLLPVDFDSAKTRPRFFQNCPQFVAKIVLTRRIVWFRRTDGKREGPKENHAWYLWSCEALRARRHPIILYAPQAHSGGAK
jgi:hypothetical protein